MIAQHDISLFSYSIKTKGPPIMTCENSDPTKLC